MELQTKKFHLVWFARKKIANSVIETDVPLHHIKKHEQFTQIFSKQKI
jgi:hypothetical protein